METQAACPVQGAVLLPPEKPGMVLSVSGYVLFESQEVHNLVSVPGHRNRGSRFLNLVVS